MPEDAGVELVPNRLMTASLSSRPVKDDITVVIPTLGRPILEECLYRMAVGAAWPSCLIVVHQGKQSEVAGWVERLKSIGLATQYVPSNQNGRSAGINRGLERVTTRFVAVTDDDCLADRNWLQKMVAHLRQSPEFIVTGRVEPAGNPDVEFCVVTSTVTVVYQRPQLKVHPLIGGNMGTAMSHVARIGLFDEHPSVASAEDSDWGYRALRLGIPIVYDPDVVVYHFNWRQTVQRADRYRQYSRSQGGFYGKYLLSGDGLILLQTVRSLVRGPVRWLRGAAVGDQDVIARGRADTLELLPGIVAGLLRRRRQP
jgi:GT2 family glycosyltransferase